MLGPQLTDLSNCEKKAYDRRLGIPPLNQWKLKRTSKVIVFVIKTMMNVITVHCFDTLKKYKKEVSLSKVFAYSIEVLLDMYYGYFFFNSRLLMVNKSTIYRGMSLIMLRFFKMRYKIPLVTIKVKLALCRAQFAHIGN